MEGSLLASTVTRIRVRYAETDQMGVVYYANYLIWMEVARVDYCQAAGFRYKDLETDHGILLAVTEAHCRYLSPARYDEEVEITTTVSRAQRRAMTFGYEMRSEATGRLVAKGYTSHMFLNREMRPTSLPERFRCLLGIPEREGQDRRRPDIGDQEPTDAGNSTFGTLPVL